MIVLSISGTLVAIVVLLCMVQQTLERQHAGFVYGLGCAAHFLLFEGLSAYKIDYPTGLYYVVAGAISLAIIRGLRKLPEYTNFHRNLQRIAFASVIINFLGGAIHYISPWIMFYQVFAFMLYFILILELARNGRSERIPRNSGIYDLFRRDTV